MQNFSIRVYGSMGLWVLVLRFFMFFLAVSLGSSYVNVNVNHQFI